MEKPNRITWTGQDKYFGLNYSTKRGKFLDFEFDIRYDCDLKDSTVNPSEDVGLWITIHFMNKKIDGTHGRTVNALVQYSERYIDEFLQKYKSTL